MKKLLFSVLSIAAAIALNAQSFSNGPLSTGANNGLNVAAPNGHTWSEVPNGFSTLGYGANYNDSGALDASVADDFMVPNGEEWKITSIEIFSYRTGYMGTTSPVNGVRAQILKGIPGIENTTVVLGNFVDNLYESGTDAMIYRVNYGQADTSRKIWKIKANLSGTLQPGVYWLEYAVRSATQATIWQPPVTISNMTENAEWNGRKRALKSWANIIDGQSGAILAMPFIINYTVDILGNSEVRQYDSRVNVYPNPTSDYFKLELPAESKHSNTKIELFDSTGKLVKTYSLQEQYNISNLPKGIYHVRIADGKNIKSTKVIKK